MEQPFNHDIGKNRKNNPKKWLQLWVHFDWPNQLKSQYFVIK